MIRDTGAVKKPKGQSGYSLIELMITMMILGVISSFIIPPFLISLDKTRATTCILYRQNMQVAADYYIKTNNLQPGNAMPTLAHLVSENLLPNVDSCPGGGIYVWSDLNYQGNSVPFLISCSIHFTVGM
jgi:prepilin-type N-terminal cleavage/methylation domain-containing protein